MGYTIKDLAPIVLVFGIGGLILTFMSLIGAQVGDEIATLQGYPGNFTGCAAADTACNTTASLLSAYGDLAGWFGLLILIVVIAMVLGMLLSSFSAGRR